MGDLIKLFTGLVTFLWDSTVVAIDSLVGVFNLLGAVNLPSVFVAALVTAFAVRIVMHFF